ncbi:MAG: DUF6263 family protein [Planctomycetaceae bacterium]
MRQFVRWSWFACVAAAALLGAVERATAQDRVDAAAEQPLMRWKLEAAQKFKLTQTQKMNMEMNVGGQPFKMDLDMEMNMGWNVDEVASDGKAKMTQTVDRVKMDMTMANQSMKFDSATPDQADPAGQALAQAIQPLIGAKITQTMDARGKIDDIQIDPEVRKKMQAAGAGFGGGLSEDSLKQMFEQIGGLPDKAVAPGTKWSETIDMSVPGTRAGMKIDSTYYGIEDRGGRKLARIDTKFSLGDASPAPADVKDDEEGEDEPQLEIKSLEGDGKTWFDVEAGRLVEADSKVDMVMSLDLGGQKVDQKVKVTSRVVVEPAK